MQAKLKEFEALEEAKQLINTFCQEQYHSPADFDDLSAISIAYTTLEEGELPVQINVDLIHHSINRYLDEALVSRWQYDTMEELISSELKHLDFDDLTFMEADAKPLIGQIEYLAPSGRVAERIQYSEPEKFARDIQNENHYGVPMSIALYPDQNGRTISTDFLKRLDPPLQGFRIEKISNHLPNEDSQTRSVSEKGQQDSMREEIKRLMQAKSSEKKPRIHEPDGR